jgi:hypothetical protein
VAQFLQLQPVLEAVREYLLHDMLLNGAGAGSGSAGADDEERQGPAPSADAVEQAARVGGPCAAAELPALDWGRARCPDPSKCCPARPQVIYCHAGWMLPALMEAAEQLPWSSPGLHRLLDRVLGLEAAASLLRCAGAGAGARAAAAAALVLSHYECVQPAGRRPPAPATCCRCCRRRLLPAAASGCI